MKIKMNDYCNILRNKINRNDHISVNCLLEKILSVGIALSLIVINKIIEWYILLLRYILEWYENEKEKWNNFMNSYLFYFIMMIWFQEAFISIIRLYWIMNSFVSHFLYIIETFYVFYDFYLIAFFSIYHFIYLY